MHTVKHQCSALPVNLVVGKLMSVLLIKQL